MPRTSLGIVLLAASGWAQPFEIAINHGRVIDPESGLDGVRHVGIAGGKIRSVSTTPLKAATVIDAKGLIVSPGFIDLHWHGRDPASYRYCVLQGVTSALEMEIGVADIAGWYREREGRSPIHFGAAAGHPPIRMAVMKDPGGFLPTGDAATRAATEEEVAEIARRLEAQLKLGAPAVGLGLAYTHGASYREILDVFRVAARFRASCHVHMRHTSSFAGDAEMGLSEVIAAAAITRAPLQVVHLNASAGKSIDSALKILTEARENGLDVTTEAYPYTAGSTGIQSGVFKDWQSQPDSWFGTLQWVKTGERLTRASFERYRKVGGSVIVHSNTPERLDKAILSPLTMISSDGSDLPGGQGHPRSAGCYARILAHYVRDRQALSLEEAIRKMALLPARRLEGRVPAMKNKGRIREGADADIAVFDLARVEDHSTYERPALEPEGFVDVLVNGEFVLRDGKVVSGVVQGRPIRAAVE
ncbi:MAG: amidohydrolase family protein [Bryobacteraceae bacterium]